MLQKWKLGLKKLKLSLKRKQKSLKTLEQRLKLMRNRLNLKRKAKTEAEQVRSAAKDEVVRMQTEAESAKEIISELKMRLKKPTLQKWKSRVEAESKA